MIRFLKKNIEFPKPIACNWFWVILLFSWLPSYGYGQMTTVDFTSSGIMSDAMVANGGVKNQNFGSQNQMNVYYQLNQQIPQVFRTFIQYDVSSIPANAVIVEAKLKLTPISVNNAVNHPLYVERVTESWAESSITWNNQPEVTSVDQISIPHADVSGSGVHELEVTKHVQQMVSDPAINNGWRIRLQTESASANFGIYYNSSEAGNSIKHPVLTVKYMLPIEMTTSVTHATAGNTDGELSVAVTGGSTFSISDVFFYKVNRDLSHRGKATLANHKTTNNVQYNAGTNTITADNMEPGVYLLRILDDQYGIDPDQKYSFYKHILVGREGEVTTGILHPNYKWQENVTIGTDKPTASNPLDRAHTNYHNQTTSIPLRISDSPNNYEHASLVKYELDFDPQLEFTKAELQVLAWSGFFKHNNSSNAATYSIVTSDWTEEVVTWNTRPTIDSSMTLSVPTTTYIGYDPVHKWDTVNLVPFVEYWQENDNHGYEMALSTYGATQLALRDYKSQNTNQNYIEFNFEVKPAVETTYDVDSETGTLTVNAPQGHTLPYKYLIGYEPLPLLDEIWTNIKDSIPVDSATFYAGDVNSTTFTFEDLDAERYYIAVYDNAGTKILNGKGLVTPDIQLLNNTNIDLTDGVLSKGNNGSTGSAQIDGLVRESESGGFEFEVTEIGGNLVFGFNNANQSVPAVTADFEYSIELFADNTFDVLKSDTILFEDTVEVGDIFRVYKQNNEVVYYLNEYEMTRTPIYVGSEVPLTGAVLYRTVLGTLSSAVKLDHFKPLIKPLTTIPSNIECGDQTGSVRASASLPAYYGGTGTYIIKDAETEATITSGDISDLWTETVSLAVGEYKIEYSYTVGGTTYNFHDYFSIGVTVFWNVLNEHFDEIAGTVNSIEAIGSLSEGLAISQNNLGYSETGWIYINTRMEKYYPLWAGPDPSYDFSKVRFRIVNQELETKVQANVYGFGEGIINKYIWVTGDEASAFTTYKEGPLKISRTGIVPTGPYNYEVSFNNNPAPFTTTAEVGTDAEQAFHAFVTGANTGIHNSYASFCGFESIRSYADLTKKLDGGYYLAQNGIVKFIYNEEYNDQDDQLTYSIYDASNAAVVTDGTMPEPVVYGDNRYDLDFSTFTGSTTLDNGVYVLQVTNEKDENWYLRFKIINN